MKTFIKSILTILFVIIFIIKNPICAEASNIPSASEAAGALANIIGISESGNSNKILNQIIPKKKSPQFNNQII